LIIKDSDFLDSFYLKNSPQKLLLISTGNIRNTELLVLFQRNILRIIDLFKGKEATFDNQAHISEKPLNSE